MLLGPAGDAFLLRIVGGGEKGVGVGILDCFFPRSRQQQTDHPHVHLDTCIHTHQDGVPTAAEPVDGLDRRDVVPPADGVERCECRGLSGRRGLVVCIMCFVVQSPFRFPANPTVHTCIHPKGHKRADLRLEERRGELRGRADVEGQHVVGQRGPAVLEVQLFVDGVQAAGLVCCGRWEL